MDTKISEFLDKDYHDQLLLNLPRLCREAGVRKQFVLSSTSNYCGEKELDWLREYKRLGETEIAGLVYIGEMQPSVGERIQALAGCLMRNYISAKVLPVSILVDLLFSGEAPQESCVLIPDFFVSGSDILGKRQVAMLVSWLINRYIAEKQTVVYLSVGIEAVKKSWGNEVGLHFKNYFRIVSSSP